MFATPLCVADVAFARFCQTETILGHCQLAGSPIPVVDFRLWTVGENRMRMGSFILADVCST